MLLYVVGKKERIMRNVCLTLTADYKMFRRISLTRNRLLSIGLGIIDALKLALDELHYRRYVEIFEEYDGNEQD